MKKVYIAFVDDLDGQSDADETVQFGLDGVDYEIDLSAVHAAELRSFTAPWQAAARKIPRRARGKRSRAQPLAQSPAVRAWARDNGYDVSPRGRMTAEVIQAYQQAHHR